MFNILCLSPHIVGLMAYLRDYNISHDIYENSLFLSNNSEY